MMLRKFKTILLSALVFLILQTWNINAQVAISDTSDFLPYFVNGSMEYNLILASESGNTRVITRLLRLGAEVDAQTEDGATPLIFAVANKKTDAVKVLLYNGADPNHITGRNETPLMIAVKNQQDEIAEVLIRYGAKTDFRDQYGCNPLHYAAVYGYLVLADLLLYYDAEIDSKSADGTTPLMAAAWSGYADVADLLIQRGANMEARDNEGFTPFLIAAQNGDTALMDLLRKKGVDIFETTSTGTNAMELAIRTDQAVAVEQLIRWDKRWIDSYPGSRSPLEVAARYGRREIIKLLEDHNFPVKLKFRPENLEISVSPLSNLKDFYTGFSLSFRESLNGLSFTAGIDTKLWYTRVTLKQDDHLYYQYMEKSSFVFAGINKDFTLTDNLYRSNVCFSAGLKGGWFFANEFKGTSKDPGSKAKVIPSLGLKWISDQVTVNISAEYFNTGYDLMAPVWCRIGIGYIIPLNNNKVQSKLIKWY